MLTALLAAVLVAAGVVAAAWMAGGRGFPIDVASTGSLVVAGAAAALAGCGNGRRTALIIGCTLIAYATLSGLAVLAETTGSPAASALVSLWSVGWAVPLAAVQLGAVLRGGHPRAAAGLALLITAALGAGALWATPADPFDGFRPAVSAPGDVLPVVDVLTGAWLLTAFLAPVALAVSARRIGAWAGPAVASAAVPLAVTACLGLAVARNPGDVDPAAGSTAFTLVLAATALAAAVVLGAAPASREITSGRVANWLVLAAVVLGGLLGGILLAALVAPAGTAAVAGTVGGLAVALTILTRWAAPRISGLLELEQIDLSHQNEPGRPAPEPAPSPHAAHPLLTARENEVMALVADGASNTEVAEHLVLSPRTVEAHMRSIYTKLDLPPDGPGHRRLRAVTQWHEGSSAA